MIEFSPFGILAGFPIGLFFFLLARRKQRGAKAWGLSMWALGALWIAGAAVLPSMSGSAPEKAAALPVAYVTAGSFLLQAVLLFSLLLSGRTATVDEAASKRRIVVLLAILALIVVITVIAVFV